MIPAFTHGLMPTGRAVPPLRPALCAVRLIDRRTGQTHRINGSPLVVYTRDPEAAAAELLAGRDATVWEARIEPLSQGNRR
jgi:hypothetical protein